MFYTQPDLLICLCVSLFSVGCLFCSGVFLGAGWLLGIKGLTFSTCDDICYKGLRTEKA